MHLSCIQVLARIEAMGVKSRFIELRETRHREERERKEAKLQVTQKGNASVTQLNDIRKESFCASFAVL